MGSSEEEGEIVSDSVTDYEFLNAKRELVPFAKLNVQWDKGKVDCGESSQIFLSGKIDNGLRNIYCEVVAWNFDLSSKNQRPQISVFSINGNWLKLQKPRSRYRELVRTIQISVNFLHLCKWSPQGSERAFWDRLSKLFSMSEKLPSEDDLQGHLALITEAVKRDATLSNCKVLTTILEGKPGKRKLVNEDTRPSFIVDDNDEVEYESQPLNMDERHNSDCDENQSETDEDDFYDPMCAICDNGGQVLMCDGKCLRSFHPTEADGRESYCDTLGFTMEELNDLNSSKWYCKNCEYKRHQCFACGELGSSNESSGAEVFCCVNGACGYFYHPLCVAKLLHPGNDTVAKEHAQRIASGEQFACPAHRCHVCKELEVKKVHDLQFAVCRRCPRSYHRKCLPRKICFGDPTGQVLRRAWDDLLPNRILIYCLEHDIDPAFETPARNHIKFPGLQQRKCQPTSSNQSNQNLQPTSSNKKDMLKKRVLVTECSTKKNLSTQPVKAEKLGMKFHAQVSTRKLKVGRNENCLEAKGYSGTYGRDMALGDKLFATFFGQDPEEKMSSQIKSLKSESRTTNKVNREANSVKDCDALNIDGKRRILTLIKVTSSSITLEGVRQQHRAPSTHSQCSSDKFVTLGKVEKTIEALTAALKILEGGGSIQDAKSFCGDDLLLQIHKWKEKLKVHLAPFLHGMRYTSFGRHFTKRDKLKQIVDILHWYIQDGDMLVDFCCGSNDFSCLMKEKLDAMKKKTSFKNYDILQPKNDFNFERRDWMSVKKDELPDGSQLIMGLNPPFGVNAGLANKFINKALEFKPKLMVLIVPRVTQRLDEKPFPYDLILEDYQMFAGKSFYLPGSVDVNDKQIEDWNVNPPGFYIWSHPDFTSKHVAIAEQQQQKGGGGSSCGPAVIAKRLDENDEKKMLRASGSSESRRKSSDDPKQGDNTMLPAKRDEAAAAAAAAAVEVKAVEATKKQESAPPRETSFASEDKKNQIITSEKKPTEFNMKRAREVGSDDPVQKGKSPRVDPKQQQRGAANSSSSSSSRAGRYSQQQPFSSQHQEDKVVDDLLMRYCNNSSNAVVAAPPPPPPYYSEVPWWDANLHSSWSHAYPPLDYVNHHHRHPHPPPFVERGRPEYAARMVPYQQGPPPPGGYQPPHSAPGHHQQGGDGGGGSLGFSQSSYRPFHPQNSSGWLND